MYSLRNKYLIGFIKVAKSFSVELTTTERMYFLRRYHCNKFWLNC